MRFQSKVVRVVRGSAAICLLALGCGERGGAEPPKPVENVGPGSPEPAGDEPSLGSDLASLQLPPGFSIELYADELPFARSLARGPSGVVFVGSTKAGQVYAVVDDDLDHRVDEVLTIADGLTNPNGVAYRDGDLYVAETGRILRYAGIDDRLRDPPKPELVTDALPTDPWHGNRYIGFGPDGWLYVGIGVPCNICDPDEPFGTIARMPVDQPGAELEIHASGIRNTVGFDWQPGTDELWFTDNGRDELGDNLPPDELNRAAIGGLDFGYPHCHGGFLVDPELGHGRTCEEFEPPAARLGPHVAALGMRFYTGEQFPESWRNSIVFAEHGSWDRADKIGYRVRTALVVGSEVVGIEPLVTGFLDPRTNEAWGRPVDVEVIEDGSLLISDDLAGAIYRVSYAAPGG